MAQYQWASCRIRGKALKRFNRPRVGCKGNPIMAAGHGLVLGRNLAARLMVLGLKMVQRQAQRLGFGFWAGEV